MKQRNFQSRQPNSWGPWLHAISACSRNLGGDGDRRLPAAAMTTMVKMLQLLLLLMMMAPSGDLRAY